MSTFYYLFLVDPFPKPLSSSKHQSDPPLIPPFKESHHKLPFQKPSLPSSPLHESTIFSEKRNTDSTAHSFPTPRRSATPKLAQAITKADDYLNKHDTAPITYALHPSVDTKVQDATNRPVATSLVLEGGGIRALSQLEMLRQMIDQLNVQGKCMSRRPVELFDHITGTCFSS
jgi:hypothetical protein